MRFEKQKKLRVLSENIDIDREVNNMKCPMCGESEKNQDIVQSGDMIKSKCRGCGTIFHNPELK